MAVKEVLTRLRNELPANTRLVAVSKFHPVEAVMEAYEAGQRIFGESRVQELCEKQPSCPMDIEWHFIGHLQTNKIKQIASFVALIHGVDSLKLLREINKEGEKIGRVIPCLLQIYIAREETKFGFNPQECKELLATGITDELKFVDIRGLMGMATFTDNTDQIRSEFKSLNHLFQELKENTFRGKTNFCELSMGMSDDYRLALQEGSTLVRIGSAIFGARVY